MAKRGKADPKILELKRTGTIHPRPRAVVDPLFQENPFFDARDLLQVRYEMLRRHSAEHRSILDAAEAFGVSRPTFYQAQAAFDRGGLAGLLPKPRGPKRGHKLSAKVVDYVVTMKAAKPGLTTLQCVQGIQDHFGITIHRRSLERALLRSKKKRSPQR
jgi:transposase